MKISKIKFVALFVIAAAVFMISSNLLLGQPAESVFGTGSFTGILLSPVKMILIGPLLPFIHFLRQDPDTPPPFFLAGFVFYWTLLALSIHYLISNLKLIMRKLRAIYDEAKADKWFQRFAVFCRIVLAVSFLPAGIVKIMGQRFAEGLPHNNPLGHYFDALLQTGYYYTFIGIAQLTIAILLLIPRTALLGAIAYFTMIINITILTYATRFDGTRLITFMLLACSYLLIWDYDRLKYLFIKPTETATPLITRPIGTRLRIYFFGSCIAVITTIILGTFYLYKITPGNSEEECRNQCGSDKNTKACQVFCDCIYKQGLPLDSALIRFDWARSH